MRLNIRENARGASLVEVLVAIVVFSLGLLGLLSAAALSIRTNADAYTSTQVVNIAEYLMGAMRRNSLGAFRSEYNGNIAAIDIYAGSPPLLRNCAAAPCTSAAQAADDRNQVALLMGQYLQPATAGANVVCDAARTFPSITGLAGPGTRPPYVGSCRLTMTWAIDRAGTLNSRSWVFQP